jgi:diaminopimelate decarboxylase
MSFFTYKSGCLHAEDVPLDELAARYGTPLYVYSRTHLRTQYRELAAAMGAVKPLICYSMKANSNGAVLRTLIAEGAGVDIVSGGELYRALRAGAEPSKIVFAGVGKTREEIEFAIQKDILFFTVESEPEAQRISECAQALGRPARIAFRVNPDVDPQTHKYISTGKKENKFGLDLERTAQAYAHAAGLPGLEIAGVHMHIGSQILTTEPYSAALGKTRALIETLRHRHPTLRYLDIGGGLGIDYKKDQTPLLPQTFAAAVMPFLKDVGLQVVMEPGRSLVGNGGVLLCRVQYLKDSFFKKFVVVDAAMNDLIRPSLYQAHHEVLPVREGTRHVMGDLVGPVCESGDFIAQDRELPAAHEGDLLAIRSAGAYGFAMASNYNSRPRPAEVLVEGAHAALVRQRESWEDLVRGEE